MNRKWKIAVIVTAVLLLAGTLAFAQSGNSPKAGQQGAPFSLDESAWCGGPRSGSGFGPGSCGGPGGYNGGPSDSGGYDGGFSCH
jgi:hypothetical protein